MLLVDEMAKPGDMQRRLDTKANEQDSTKRTLERKGADVKEKAHD